MAAQVIVHNPAFLEDDELIGSFIARQADFDWTIRGVKVAPDEGPRHLLVYGPRGSGKTMLARRVAVELRRDPMLDEKWYPIALPEEINHVGTPGEFWLEVVTQIAQETEQEKWTDVVDQLMDEQDEMALNEKSLSKVVEFAESKGTQILLVVENFSRLIDKQIKVEGALALLDSLTRHPNITLLSTATALPADIGDANGELHPYFQTRKLEPLSEDECSRIWESVTGIEPDEGRIKALRILTGGNARLLVIMSRFGADKSLKSLMNELTHLVDEHTAYFKNIIDSLSLTEGKVFHALAEIWKPATAREVARIARYDTSTTSSYLAQLVDRGLVEVVREHKRKKWYQLTERMYNIYYLVRRHRSQSRIVENLIRFMVSWFGEEERAEIARPLADEAQQMEQRERDHHRALLIHMLNSIDDAKDLESISDACQGDPDITEAIRRRLDYQKTFKLQPELAKLLSQGDQLFDKDLIKEAEQAYLEASKRYPDSIMPWYKLAVLYDLGMHDRGRAEKAYRRIAKINKPVGFGLLGDFHLHRTRNYAMAEEAYLEGLQVNQNHAHLWGQLAYLRYHWLGAYEAAEEAYVKSLALDPSQREGWLELASLRHGDLSDPEGAEDAYKKAIELDPTDALPWTQLGLLYEYHLHRFADAESAFRKALELGPEMPGHWWYALGRILDEKLNRYQEAKDAYRKSIEIDKDHASPAYRDLIFLLLWDLAQNSEALDVCREFLASPDVVESRISDAVDSLLELALFGHANEALEILKESPSAGILEPLVIALQMLLQEEVNAPIELMEVAEDILNQLKERCLEVQPLNGGDDSPPEG